jgi:hypothetical protein
MKATIKPDGGKFDPAQPGTWLDPTDGFDDKLLGFLLGVPGPYCEPRTQNGSNFPPYATGPTARQA